MRKKSNWLILLGLVIIGILIGGKIFMNKSVEKNSDEKLYQDAFTQIQKDVTDYLVKNYQGIEKIAWEGIGIEYRNSDIYGPSLLGNYVDSDVRIYVSKDNYFTMTYQLSEEMSFDDDKNMYVYRDWNKELDDYVLRDSVEPEWIDRKLAVEMDNRVYKRDKMAKIVGLEVSEKEKKELENIKVSKYGSPKTKIIYNLKIKELRY